MCWIGYAEKDRSQIPAVHMLHAHWRNDDAWGIMYPEAGRVRIIRETTRHNSFRAAWKHVPTKTPVAAHFRYGTSGAMDRTMAHPFPVLEDDTGVQLAVMHNGVMMCVADEGGLSDTAVFIRDILQPQLFARPDLIEVEGWRRAMGAILGEDNKLLFMRGDGQTFLVNGHQGEWFKGGVWYSNLYSLAPPKAKTKPSLNDEQPASFGARAWGGAEDDWHAPPAGTLAQYATTTARAGYVNEPLDDYDAAGISGDLPDLGSLLESELYNWVCSNSPEDITDAIIELRGGC